MLLQKTKDGSQFHRLHIKSNLADTIFTAGTPSINKKPICVLQILFVEDSSYNIIIEFEYIKEKVA